MPAGQPTFAKFGSKKRADYLQALREGNNRCTAARSVGVSPELVRLYRNSVDTWRGEEEAAELEACGKVEDALFNTAIGGNVTAQQVFLYNRASDRWKDQRNLKITKGVEEMTDEELLAVASGGRNRISPPPGPPERNGVVH